MPKYDFQHGCSPVNLLHIFRTPFLKNTSRWLLLMIGFIENDLITKLPLDPKTRSLQKVIEK